MTIDGRAPIARRTPISFVRWLNANAEPGSLVLVGVAEHVVASVQEIWLREDLQFDSLNNAQRRLAQISDGNGPAGNAYYMYITRKNWYRDPRIRTLEERAAPAHQIEVDGGVILKIYKIL